MSTIEILDVTKIEPKKKHPVIFEHFDVLEQGEAFIISNDHDPKPLYYQLLGERGSIFTWDYLEEGPALWRVKIGKRTTREGVETIGQIAAKDIRKADVFRRMGIDFCCGGKQTLKEACEQAGVSEEHLQFALKEAVMSSPSVSQDFTRWDLDFLIDYIIQTHHKYLMENARIISDLGQKVAQRHGKYHPELKKLVEGLSGFLRDMMTHIMKEEMILFPAIRQMVAKERDPKLETGLTAGLVREAIMMMQTEHEISGEDLKFFRKITHDYALPEDACNSYTYLFEKIKEFESDLLQHIHLENNILFPAAVKLESKFSAHL
ncbi:MAG TPA: iron-sulfur cluster repair di-iron protein [Puia sp.]|jgi:regulator of cell morphogenesis and NO signaling|nr:iron-sulfur cluster repair di-iron protein [Puia sp.]